MEITSEKIGAVFAIQLAGRLDAQTSKAVEEQLLSLIEGGERILVLDLSQLDYISSVGLRVFMLTAKRLKSVNGRMTMCALPPAVQQIFDIAGFSSMFRIFPTQAEAVAGQN
jgi:anti-anti-sigma factor